MKTVDNRLNQRRIVFQDTRTGELRSGITRGWHPLRPNQLVVSVPGADVAVRRLIAIHDWQVRSVHEEVDNES